MNKEAKTFSDIERDIKKLDKRLDAIHESVNKLQQIFGVKNNVTVQSK